jgi:transcriptional regulator with XRE-family HTH domain
MPRSTEHNPQLHEVLKALREAAGLRQDVWADQLGVSRATVQRWERGGTPPNEEIERKIVEWAREYGMFRQFHRGVLQGITINEAFLHDMFLEARGARHTKLEEESDSEELKRWVTYWKVLLVVGAVVILLGGRDQVGTPTPIPATPTPTLAVSAPPIPPLTPQLTPAFAPSPTPNTTSASLYDDFNSSTVVWSWADIHTKAFPICQTDRQSCSPWYRSLI